MKYVFGPVPSRRLGQSLGIDTIPLKTCNWNCVYCQLGRTKPLVNDRRDYFPPEEILAEVRDVLDSTAPGRIDWVTFVGSGEPLLHSSMGRLLHDVKAITELPVAVITNGSLLYCPEIRTELLIADAVLPTLDAGTADTYRKLNRPHPGCTFERSVNGLIEFRSVYRGRLWVEVMLVLGMNDSAHELEKIAGILEKIRPEAVHINLPTRPPAETWVQPPDKEGLMRAISILGNVAEVVHPAEGSFDLAGYENVTEAVISIITRHPMRQDELERTLCRWSREQLRDALAELEASGRVQIVDRHGTRFWSAAPAYYPDDAQSRKAMPDRH
ncbi:MAG: radical SAM protein [Anaerolineales bacterium]|nr:MAG: radical SAM protein [Anaerolineales bacterium]